MKNSTPARDGTRQSDRFRYQLDPNSIQIDGRDVADFLEFAKKLSTRVIYHQMEKTSTDLVKQEQASCQPSTPNNWEAFFDIDPEVIIASAARSNPNPHSIGLRNILSSKRQVSEGQVRAAFNHLSALVEILDEWSVGTRNAEHLHDQIIRQMKADIGSELKNMKELHNSAATSIHGIRFNPDAYERLIETVDSVEIGNLGIVKNAAQVTSFKELIDDLQSVLDPLSRTLTKIVEFANSYLERGPQDNARMEPHLALFIAFLRLYQLIRKDLNGLSKKHLDFFYKKVLLFEKREELPDQIHLVAKLARQVEQHHLLQQSVQVSAGEDSQGNSLVYATDDEFVINRATVDDLRTIHLEQTKISEEADVEQKMATQVFAAPIANSANGSGAKFAEGVRPSWPTLGIRRGEKSSLGNSARVGFAISSKDLLLAQAERKIKLTLSLAEPLSRKLNPNEFEFQLSGKQGWISLQPVGDSDSEEENLIFILKLSPAEPAVTLANAEVLKLDLGTTDPILMVTLKSTSDVFEVLKKARVTGIQLETRVKGLTNLVVQIDQLVIDATKEFQPLGPIPKHGSNFYLGVPEAFDKKLTTLSIKLDWLGLPPKLKDYYSAYVGLPPLDETPSDGKSVSRQDFTWVYYAVQDGRWNKQSAEKKLLGKEDGSSFVEVDLIEESPLNQSSSLLNGDTESGGDSIESSSAGGADISTAQRMTNENPQGSIPKFGLTDSVLPKTTNAILRFRLHKPEYAFLHEYYAAVLTKRVLTGGKEIPNPPYTPTLGSISVEYTSVLNTIEKDDAGRISFFHIEPFGFREISLSELNNEQDKRTISLLPTFNFEGSLHIGLSNLRPKQNLTLLFKFAEGTANPESKTSSGDGRRIQWWYLDKSDDDWLEIDTNTINILSDATNQLLDSGIINFQIPEGVNGFSSRMGNELVWLRATAESGADGVSETVGVHPNAVMATSTKIESGEFNTTPLPPETVTDFVLADESVDSVEQPYSGFGGRPKETDTEFYTRVSEHLRHKGRPITAFDYERIVLQNFPSIYKVKCISHTKPIDEIESQSSHETAPGHVLLAVIPDLRGLSLVDRRQPRVTLNELNRISRFLEKINCPFVSTNENSPTLHVMNPLYETFTISCKIRFHRNITAPERQLDELQQKLNRFLSPWAYEEEGEISFGDGVSMSSIVLFLENQPCVDNVREPKFLIENQDGSEAGKTKIEAKSQRSVLVPAERHDLKAIRHSSKQPKSPMEGAKT